MKMEARSLIKQLMVQSFPSKDLREMLTAIFNSKGLNQARGRPILICSRKV